MYVINCLLNLLFLGKFSLWFIFLFSFSTYLSRILSIPQDLCDYRRWVQKLYEKVLYVAKATSIPPSSPIYRGSVMSQYQSDGRTALLPTPPSPFSPRLSLVSPPFSPFTTNSSNVPYSPIGFFTNNMQGVILTNASTNTSTIIHPSQGIRLPNLQIPQQQHQNSMTSPHMGQIAYVVPTVFNPPQVEQLLHKPPTPVYSPVKTVPHTGLGPNNPLFPTTYPRNQSSTSFVSSSHQMRSGTTFKQRDVGQWHNKSTWSKQDTEQTLNTPLNSVDSTGNESITKQQTAVREPVLNGQETGCQQSDTQPVNIDDSIIEIKDDFPLNRKRTERNRNVSDDVSDDVSVIVVEDSFTDSLSNRGIPCDPINLVSSESSSDE